MKISIIERSVFKFKNFIMDENEIIINFSFKLCLIVNEVLVMGKYINLKG